MEFLNKFNEYYLEIEKKYAKILINKEIGSVNLNNILEQANCAISVYQSMGWDLKEIYHLTKEYVDDWCDIQYKLEKEDINIDVVKYIWKNYNYDLPDAIEKAEEATEYEDEGELAEQWIEDGIINCDTLKDFAYHYSELFAKWIGISMDEIVHRIGDKIYVIYDL